MATTHREERILPCGTIVNDTGPYGGRSSMRAILTDENYICTCSTSRC